MSGPETTAIEVIGPYRGKRIAGASDAVVAVRISRRYRFDGDTVHVRDIPAKRDDGTGAIDVSAPVAKRLHTKLDEIATMMEQVRAQGGEGTRSIRPNFSLDASEFLDAA